MKILFILHFHECYGSVRSLLDLVVGLQKHDLDAAFLIPREGGLTKYLSERDIPHSVTPVPWWMAKKPLTLVQKVSSLIKLIMAGKTIKNLVETWQIDLIYTSTSVTPVGRMAARFGGVPHIWHIREFGDLDFSLRFIYPKIFCKSLIKRSDAVICHAQAVREHWFKSGGTNIHQVYNGVATRAQFDQRLDKRKSTPGQSLFTFAMLSALTPNKGQEAAIRALGTLKARGVPARLRLAGLGKPDYVNYLKSLVRTLNITDQVDFLGFVDDPFTVYNQVDCALICSAHEALSRVGLEAMSTALPLIGKNSGGNPEIINHEDTGLLYDSFNELVGCMGRLVANPGWARQLGLAGWRTARDKFNIEDYAANVYQVIQTVMQKKP